MTVFVKLNALMLTSYWILSFRQSHFVFGERPHCVGDPLKHEQFSKEEDVGFVRDVCVDSIARNLYKTLGSPPSSLCEKLANIRTSTCFFKICFKWKRSSSGNQETTNRVMTLAEGLIDNFNEVLLKDASLTYPEENFIFECVDGAESRLVKSGAATEDSKIVGQLEELKKYCCTRNQLHQHQTKFQESIGRSDTWLMKPLRDYIENKEVIAAIKRFIRNFEAKSEMKISTYYIEDNVVEKATLSGVIRLKFKYGKGRDTKAGSVILKIPSLAPSYYETFTDIYDREAYFYETLLPALYHLGQCEPFAPKIFAATEKRTLVLEDLSVEGYEPNRIKSVFIDLDHSRIFLNVLAKYHALSYMYLRNLSKDNPNMSLIGSLQTTIQTATKPEEFYAFCEVVKPFLRGPLYQKIMRMEKEILANLATINNRDENSITVIIHGDLHARNVLFKYDFNGKVYEAKIIDWQFGREASPILDLIDFFLINIDIDTFEANEDDLLDSYLTTLNHNLSSLSANREYNRPELERDMAFFKYYYFRVLSLDGQDILNLNFLDKNTMSKNVAKWVIYLEKKGFI